MINFKCKCGFKVEGKYNTVREYKKMLRENLVTANLFGCEKCTMKIRNKIKEVYSETIN